MRPMAWLFSAVLVVGLLGALSPASPAAAAGPVTTTTLSSATNIAPGDKVTVLERSFTLAAGESRHLRARIDTTSSTDAVVALTLSITCVDASGAEVDKGRATARNHEGRNAPYKIPGRLPIYADALLTAPAAGSYTCAMQAWTASNATSDYHLTAVAGDTWLQSSDTDQVGAYQWTNPACDSQGTLASCTYLGAGSDREWLFYSGRCGRLVHPDHLPPGHGLLPERGDRAVPEAAWHRHRGRCDAAAHPARCDRPHLPHHHGHHHGPDHRRRPPLRVHPVAELGPDPLRLRQP